jgi:hypothetical protein
MNLALVLKQTKSNTMNRGITPSFIKETASTIEVVEVVFVSLASPKCHIPNLEITPEMAGRVPLSFSIRRRSTYIIGDPSNSTVIVDVGWMLGEELDGLGP